MGYGAIAQLFIVCFNLIFLRSGLLGWEVLFMQFGLKMIQFSKCRNYFIKHISCFVQMFSKAGFGFVVFVFVQEETGYSGGWLLVQLGLVLTKGRDLVVACGNFLCYCLNFFMLFPNLFFLPNQSMENPHY